MKATSLRKGLLKSSFALAWLLGGTMIFAAPIRAQEVTTSGLPAPSEGRQADYIWNPQWKWWSKNHRYHFDWCYRKAFRDEYHREFYICYPRKPYGHHQNPRKPSGHYPHQPDRNYNPTQPDGNYNPTQPDGNYNPTQPDGN